MARIASLVGSIEESVIGKLAGKRWSLLLPVAFLVALAIVRALTVPPWCDEAWFASPSINLATRGFMGTTIFACEPLQGLSEHTFWQLPLGFITEAGWFTVFGVGLFQLRALSIFWGVIGLISLFFIAKHLSLNNKKVIFITILLVATNWYYVKGTSDGRLLDIMSASLSFAAFASYLSWRENHLKLALLFSSLLAAAAVLTHPVGVIAFVGLLFLFIYYDRSQITISHVVLWILPYALAAVGWGCYILRDVDAFQAQFISNVIRTEHMGFTWQVIVEEFSERYGLGWGFASSAFSSVILLMMAIAGFMCRRERMLRPVFGLCFTSFIILMFAVGNKTACYNVHIIPLLIYSMVSVWDLLRKRRLLHTLLTGLLVGMMLGSLFVMTLSTVKLDPSYSDYLLDMNYAKTQLTETDVIYGNGTIAFALGFKPEVRDDRALDCSQVTPDFFVLAKKDEELMKKNKPEVYARLQSKLSSDFALIYEGNYCKLYKSKK